MIEDHIEAMHPNSSKIFEGFCTSLPKTKIPLLPEMILAAEKWHRYNRVFPMPYDEKDGSDAESFRTYKWSNTTSKCVIMLMCSVYWLEDPTIYFDI